VLGGVIAGTLLNVLFVPLFFVAIRSRLDRRTVREASGQAVAAAPTSAHP
jgi:multidrug efflux pump